MRRVLCVLLLLLWAGAVIAQPGLPATDGKVTLTVQDGPDAPARELVVSLFYPRGTLAQVNAQTGLMLVLHNWGGMDLDGAPSPVTLANTCNVVSIAVRYYQSGDRAGNPLPYDFGYLQAWDALRALHYVYQALRDAETPFDAGRVYGTGGSGGGNVIMMANKFAPRTFACIVDLSGMASLTDDIAYGLPGGSGLNARYSRDPASPAYLTKGMQQIRDLGHPAHLATMAKLGNRCRLIMIHGDDDGSCLASDARRVAAAMLLAGLRVQPHFIDKTDVDGTLVTDSGHALGNRTSLLLHFAADYLTPGSAKLCRLAEPIDFERRDRVTYETDDARYTMDYTAGAPVLSRTPIAPNTPAVAVPTTETLLGDFVPVWPPRFPEGYTENETASGTIITTTVPGKVVGLRFYKFAGAGHTMWIYNQDTQPPTLLATLTFTAADETAAGWQQKMLDTPIALQPGVKYMVWRSCEVGEKHGWVNSAKPKYGFNGKHLNGGGYYRGTVEGNGIVPLAKNYLTDIVDSDIIFLPDK